MTSTTTTAIPSSRTSAEPPLFSTRGLVMTLVLGSAFVYLFFPFLLRMGKFGVRDPDWSHIFLIPLLSLYFLFQRKREILDIPSRLYWPGLAMMLAGMIGFALGIYPIRNDMTQGYSMITALFGLILFLNGPSRMTILWLPVVYLVFAVVISEGIWLRISFPLQLIASTGGTYTIKFVGLFTGFDARVSGAQIFLFDGRKWLPPLGVEEACSGLKMLMTFIALGSAMAFISTHRRWWQRLIIVASTIPVALLINILRVAALGIIYASGHTEYAQGDFHIFVGLLMLIPAAGIFWLIGWVLDQILIEDAPTRSSKKKPLPAAVLERQQDESQPWNWNRTLIGCVIGLGLTAVAGLMLFASLKMMDPILNAIRGLPAGGILALAATYLGYVTVLILPPVMIAIHFLQRKLQPQPVRAGGLAVGMVGFMLLTSALGLQAAISKMGLVLFKEPLPLRQPLQTVPEFAGTWQMVSEDPRLPPDIERTLGTEIYISRVYENTAVTEGPGRFVRLHLAFYTGTTDTVPHVPERCFIGGGHQSAGVDIVPLRLRGPQFRQQPIAEWDESVPPGSLEWVADLSTGQYVRVPRVDFRGTRFNFVEQSADTLFGTQTPNKGTVIYFFVADGGFQATPLEVRQSAFNARNRFSFYCKVEIHPIDVQGNPDLARDVAEGFLQAFMPYILRALPDWTEVMAGRYPETAAARLQTESAGEETSPN